MTIFNSYVSLPEGTPDGHRAFDRAAVRVLGRDLPEARPAVGRPGGQEVSIVDVHQARALVGGLVHHLETPHLSMVMSTPDETI